MRFMSENFNLLSNYFFLLIFENLLIFGLGLIIIVEIIIEHLRQIVFFSQLSLY